MHRRNFLGLGLGGAALASFAVGCRPPAPRQPTRVGLANPESTTPSLEAMAGLPEQRERMLGYPVNMALPPEGFSQWRRELARVGVDQFAFNNVGDPFKHSHFPFNSHGLERELIERFARLYRFASGEAWGFLSHSGTDSNMHGLYMGRTVLERRAGARPKIYFTAEAHYSIQILANLLGLEWVRVGTHPDGRMDEHDLARVLAEHPDHPALVVATIGTTFKGAVDSVDAIQAQLEGRESYLHLDAALFGGYLPHTEFANELGQRIDGVPRYDSLAVSCHKFFGFPSPAGIFITTRTVFETFHEQFSLIHDPEYLLQVPGTITCSRDAVKPAEFFYFSTDEAFARLRADASQVLADTSYLLEQMQSRAPELEPARANSMSNTIYFRSPDEAVVSTYSLATMGLERDGERVPYAHVVVMPHATRELLDRFLSELEAR